MEDCSLHGLRVIRVSTLGPSPAVVHVMTAGAYLSLCRAHQPCLTASLNVHIAPLPPGLPLTALVGRGKSAAMLCTLHALPLQAAAAARPNAADLFHVDPSVESLGQNSGPLSLGLPPPPLPPCHRRRWGWGRAGLGGQAAKRQRVCSGCLRISALPRHSLAFLPTIHTHPTCPPGTLTSRRCMFIIAWRLLPGKGAIKSRSHIGVPRQCIISGNFHGGLPPAGRDRGTLWFGEPTPWKGEAGGSKLSG